MMDQFRTSRRWLLRGICCSIAGLGGVLPESANAAAAKKPEQAHPTIRLKEDEPRAKTVAYQYAARKVDRAKYPTYRPGQSCTTCKLMELGSAPQRVCSLFPDRLVNSGGWCNVWVRRGT
jgi:hypothetical protein